MGHTRTLTIYQVTCSDALVSQSGKGKLMGVGGRYWENDHSGRVMVAKCQGGNGPSGDNKGIDAIIIRSTCI